MNTIQKIILIFIILVSPSKLFASYEITKGCETALVEILNLRLNEAQDQLNKEKLIAPDNYYIDYLENYKDMVEILVLEDIKIYKKYFETLHTYIGAERKSEVSIFNPIRTSHEHLLIT